MRIINGDIFDHSHERAIIVHQVNCQGKFGAGIAKTIRDKYPRAYKYYMKDYEHGFLKLGFVRFVSIDPDFEIVNACGQEYYGRDGKQYTNYEGLLKCFKEIRYYASKYGYDVLLPYGIGCGLAGGDWKIVSKMIDDVLGDLAYIYKKES